MRKLRFKAMLRDIAVPVLGGVKYCIVKIVWNTLFLLRRCPIQSFVIQSRRELLSKEKLVIATRRSLLALWQAEFVKYQLESMHDGLEVELLPMVTKGDKILDSPLSKIGGKGLFVKELEHAILDRRADIAVHSMKDVPMALPDDLEITVLCKREDPTDCLVGSKGAAVDSLPEGARVGTSSLRRQSQIRHVRPDLDVRELRGNIHTRIEKLENGEYQAIILATSGLMRMGMEAKISSILSKQVCLPAVGQGALGIESRKGDERVSQLIKPLNCDRTQIVVAAERAMNKHLMGGCQVPIAGYATIIDTDANMESKSKNAFPQLSMKGLVGSVDGKRIYRSNAETALKNDTLGSVHIAEKLGIGVAEALLTQGAGAILEALKLDALKNDSGSHNV